MSWDIIRKIVLQHQHPCSATGFGVDQCVTDSTKPMKRLAILTSKKKGRVKLRRGQLTGHSKLDNIIKAKSVLIRHSFQSNTYY
jgi:hypothetical protein